MSRRVGSLAGLAAKRSVSASTLGPSTGRSMVCGAGRCRQRCVPKAGNTPWSPSDLVFPQDREMPAATSRSRTPGWSATAAPTSRQFPTRALLFSAVDYVEEAGERSGRGDYTRAFEQVVTWSTHRFETRASFLRRSRPGPGGTKRGSPCGTGHGDTAGTHSCRPKHSKLLKKRPCFVFYPVYI